MMCLGKETIQWDILSTQIITAEADLDLDRLATVVSARSLSWKAAPRPFGRSSCCSRAQRVGSRLYPLRVKDLFKFCGISGEASVSSALLIYLFTHY